MTDRELMQMALDAMAKCVECGMDEEAIHLCVTSSEALRARLAQPEPEPVAWRFYDGGMWCYVDHLTDLPQDKFEPLYTAPPQREWQGLTEDEALALGKQYYHSPVSLMYAVEAKLKEKNA